MSFDYKEITDNLETSKIISLMQELGADRYKEVDNAVIFPTICHNVDSSEASMKLYYYKDSHIFYCFTDCTNMNIFKFLKNYYDTRQIQYNWYEDILQVVISCSASTIDRTREPNAYKSQRDNYIISKRKELTTYPKGIIDVFTKHYPIEWLNDGISRDSMDKYDIRFSPIQNKIIIPHFNAQGGLVGIRGRALDAEECELFGKYMPVQIEDKWYSHPLSLNLYGLNIAKENIKKYGYCFIGESEKFCMQVDGFDMPNCAVASCGSSINKFQIKQLMEECAPREIIVCYDREERDGEDKYFNKLYSMCKKYSNYANMSFVYDRKKLSKMKDSPSDNGQDIFNALVRERVKV